MDQLEPKILLEGMKDDFKAVAEGVQMVNEKLDRHILENREDNNRINGKLDQITADVSVLKADVSVLKADVAKVKTDVSEIRKDLNDHRSNTELHTGQKRA